MHKLQIRIGRVMCTIWPPPPTDTPCNTSADKRESHSVEQESISPFHLSPQPTTFLLSLLSSTLTSSLTEKRESEKSKKGVMGVRMSVFFL
ncbi:hypothetical protein VNO80_16963 [Phaseolus coccineus]|uniref:Uncharacterized protein n=1 Tax=Phaseolus coccineus TaxID=3886 RepID=A0AAN9MUA2_PHACN